jgi:hypothetical protein
MWLLFYLLLSVVSIAVAVFVIKLIVSLRVAHHAPAWETLGDKRSGAANVDRVRGEMRAERVLAVADRVPVGKRVGRSSSKQPGKRKKVA